MKKTILTVLLCGVLVLGITGCGKTKNEFEIGEKSDIVEVNPNNGISMSIKEGTLTDTGATIILTNNSDKDFQYGNPYEIEIKKDGEWHKINVELNFTLPAFDLKAGESKEIKLGWKEGYGKLASGTYRIIKHVSYEKEEGNFETFNIAVEFNIDSD